MEKSLNAFVISSKKRVGGFSFCHKFNNNEKVEKARLEQYDKKVNLHHAAEAFIIFIPNNQPA